MNGTNQNYNNPIVNQTINFNLNNSIVVNNNYAPQLSNNYHSYLPQFLSQTNRRLVGMASSAEDLTFRFELIKIQLTTLLHEYFCNRISLTKLIENLNYEYFSLKQLPVIDQRDKQINCITILYSQLINFLQTKFQSKDYYKQCLKQDLAAISLIFGYTPLSSKLYVDYVDIKIINKQELLHDFFIYCWIEKKFETIQFLIHLFPQFFEQSANLTIVFLSESRSEEKRFQTLQSFGALLAASGQYAIALNLIKNYRLSENRFLDELGKKMKLISLINSHQLFDFAIQRQEISELWDLLHSDLNSSVFIDQICLRINHPSITSNIAQSSLYALYRLFKEDLKNSPIFINFYHLYYNKNLINSSSLMAKHFQDLLPSSSSNNQSIRRQFLNNPLPISQTLGNAIPYTPVNKKKFLQNLLNSQFNLGSKDKLAIFKSKLKEYEQLPLAQEDDQVKELIEEIHSDIKDLFNNNIEELFFFLDFTDLKSNILDNFLTNKNVEKKLIGETVSIRITHLNCQNVASILCLKYLIENKVEKLKFVLTFIQNNSSSLFSFKINYQVKTERIVTAYKNLSYWHLLFSFEKYNLIKNQIDLIYTNQKEKFKEFLARNKQAKIDNQPICLVDIIIQKKMTKPFWNVIQHHLTKEDYTSLITCQILVRFNLKNKQENNNQAWKDLFSIFGRDGLLTLDFFKSYNKILNKYNQDPLEIKSFMEAVILRFPDWENFLRQKNEDFLRFSSHVYNEIILENKQIQTSLAYSPMPTSFVTLRAPTDSRSSRLNISNLINQPSSIYPVSLPDSPRPFKQQKKYEAVEIIVFPEENKFSNKN